jgi:S-adenosylmethionine synthetase
VRAECAVSNAILFIAARFASTANIDFARVARKTIQRVGYDQTEFNARSCSVLSTPQSLPLDSATRFDETQLTDTEIENIPAKNQVNVFGFACDQSQQLMPLPIWLAHRIARRLTETRRSGKLPWLLPDGRVQVGVEYHENRPNRLHSISMEMHLADPERLSAAQLTESIQEQVIAPVMADETVQPDARTIFNINPTGPYAGGPANHSGLTGRKSAMDTYGEYARRSGKALSGKDPLRIDRSAVYAARHAAKNIVAAGLARECEVMLNYVKGLSRPVSITAQTFGTGLVSDERLTRLLEEHFDFRPAAILRRLRLRRLPAESTTGFYQKLAAYGHFGRADIELPWEKTDLAQTLAAAAVGA